MSNRRRKPRLFAFSRDTELENLQRLGLRPAEHRVLVQALDAFLDVANSRHLTVENLVPIVAAAMHPSLVVRGIGTQRLVVMSHYFSEAKTALQDLCHDKDATVRAFTVSNLGNAPWPFSLPLINGALNDPEAPVRRAAAKVCSVVATPELRDLVDAHLETEEHEPTRAALAQASRYQRELGR
ncbi:MAG: HEAT repeat domain-containing protein [Proteobacteria bacterium]|jgi:hypothetical protein|nr:HEAT repeat domain-containing protein [Pseudomonadota bacterium]